MGHLLLPLFLAALDIISTAAALLLSAYLRFDVIVPEKYLDLLVMQLPSFIILTLMFALMFKLYDRIWRYAGSSELLAVTGTAVCAAFSWYAYSLLLDSLLPRSMYIISGVLLLLFLGSSRLALRVYNYLSCKPGFSARFSKNRCFKKVLIIGAGDAGAVIAREIERYHSDGRNVVGFIDDDEKKIGKRMFGVKVVGNRLAIKENVVRLGVEEIIVAMPSVKGEALKQILEICKRTKCKLKILPGVYELIDGTVSVSQLRNVGIEDLLGREAVKLNTAAVSAYLKDKIVLVTGAGGSIGSEICRQIAKMQPQKMLLLGKGGPVTVTHPDMKRYFMTIPEASQLVLQAGAMAKGGEVFVLDMGEPVKICDLAKTLITLSGLTPEKDIEIKYTGLRPGEKLFEELLSAEDGTEETCHEKIFTAKLKKVSKEKMDMWVQKLLEQADEENVVGMLKKVVPTYTPNRIKD